MEERQFKGIWIPKEIWITDELSLQEKVILVEIDSLETEDKGCYASNKYFADFFKLTTQRVSQIIKELEKKQYIKINYITKNKQILERQIRLQKPPYPEVSNIFDRGIKYSKEGYQENFKENNIERINNKENINNKLFIQKNFKKPTLEEVKSYCEERGNSVDAEYFLDYYESKGWMIGKNHMKDWKACVRTWEKKTTKKKTREQEIEEMVERLSYLDEEK